MSSRELLSPPDLWPPVGLPPEEHQATIALHSKVFSLRYFVESFAASLELFRFARLKPEYIKRNLAWQWQWIAVHECVMQISFVNESFGVIRAHALRLCPTAVANTDSASMRRATKLFNEYFPNIRELRHTVAHHGYVSMHPSKHAPAGGYAVSGFRHSQDRYEATYEGANYHLDIDDETHRKLASVVKVFWASFAPVEKAFDQAGRSD